MGPRGDLSRVTPLVLEANSIPLFSRLKVLLQRVFDDLSSGGAGNVSTSAGGTGKRVPRLSAQYAEGVAAIAPSIMQSTSLATDDGNSTDEDSSYVDVAADQAHLSLAPASLHMWPPVIGFGPALCTAPKRPAPKEEVSDNRKSIAEKPIVEIVPQEEQPNNNGSTTAVDTTMTI
jgi:hypothetical protein